MTLYFQQTQIANITQALPCYKAREFQSPTRSTVPLLCLLDDPTWSNIVASLLPGGGKMDAYLEYTVLPPGQDKGASCTDIMLLTGQQAVAIEAKWTEPRYDTVAAWVQQYGNPTHRQKVLASWLTLLRSHATRSMHEWDIGGLPYQMIHRAASACYTADTDRTPVMAYLHFTCPPWSTLESAWHLHRDLDTLHALLGYPIGFPFYLIEVTMQPTQVWNTISHLPKGQQVTAAAVQAAIKAAPLFTFPSVTIHTI